MGAKALADKMGVTRQHTAYHIGELLRLGLVKDVRAGSVVIYHVTDLGRTVLKRIHSISAPRTEEVARDAAARSAPSPATPAARSAFHPGKDIKKVAGFSLALAGLGLLSFSIVKAFVDRQPSYVIGGLIVFAAFMVARAIAMKGISNRAT